MVDFEKLIKLLREANARMDAAQAQLGEPYVSTADQGIGFYTDEERLNMLSNNPVLDRIHYKLTTTHMTTDMICDMIEDAIDKWQEGDGEGIKLARYLGLTQIQYEKYVLDPEGFAEDVLNGII